jgi:hypothetical protein
LGVNTYKEFKENYKDLFELTPDELIAKLPPEEEKKKRKWWRRNKS